MSKRRLFGGFDRCMRKKVITEEICFSRSVETSFKVEEPGHENRE